MSPDKSLEKDYSRITNFHLPSNLGRPLRIAAIGGGAPDAFFGPAAWFPALMSMPMFKFVGGKVSRHGDVSLDFAARYFIDPSRIYETTNELIQSERNRDDGIDAAVIVTPTAFHAEDALKLANAGIPFICEKPMTHTASSARELVDAVYKNKVRVALAYTQTTSPMAVRAAEISLDPNAGKLIAFNGQYLQGWLSIIREQGTGGYRQEQDRTDPALTGSSCVTADLSTHLFDYLLSVGQGAQIARINSTLNSTRGRHIDDESIVVLELTNGARGVLRSNNAWPNRRNNMIVDMAYEKVSTTYHGEESDHLTVEWSGKPTIVYHNAADEGLSGLVQGQSHMPAGHEGSAYHYKLRSIARAFGEAVIADKLGVNPACLKRPYRTAIDGLKGVQFAEMAVQNNEQGWVDNPFVETNKTLPSDSQKIGILT